MPRGILSHESFLEAFLRARNQQQGGVAENEDESDSSDRLTFGRKDKKEVQLSNTMSNTDGLHPYVQVLSTSDLDACVALETASFPEKERCSREKVGWVRSFSCT